MHFKVLFVLVLVVVCAAHPGEPQSWLSTVFELVERLVGTEQTVKATDVKVNSLTDAVSAGIDRLNGVDEKLTKLQTLEEAMSANLNKMILLEEELKKARDDAASAKQEQAAIRETMNGFIASDSASKSDQIAFYATLTTDVRSTFAGQAVIFDKITTNLGGAYDGSSGTFTAPVNGVYVFSLTIRLYGYSGYTYQGTFQLMVNGAVQLSLYPDTHSQNSRFSSSSGTAVLTLDKGDTVHVVSKETKNFIEGDDSYSSYFSGFLLK